MSVAFDTSANFSHSSVDNWTDNYTTSGSNRILIVTLYINQGRTVTALTYNGVALTQLGATQNLTSSTWYLLNPASGTHALAGTLSASSNGFTIVAVSYTGANQSTLDNNAVNSTSSSTSFSQSLTPTVPNCLVIGVTQDDGSGGRTFTAGANTTRRATDASDCAIFEHNGFVSPAASTAIVATISGSATVWYYWLISLAPIALTSSTANTTTATDALSISATRVINIANTITVTDLISVAKKAWRNLAKTTAVAWDNLNKS